VAIAPDGDEVATLDMAVPSAETAMDAPALDVPTPGAAIRNPVARADGIVIHRSRTGFAWAILGLIIGQLGGMGMALTWRATLGERRV
jgi:hypothetical protein